MDVHKQRGATLAKANPLAVLLSICRFPLALLAATAGAGSSLHAQVDTTRVAELERRIQILAEELERMRSGEETALTEEEARLLGLSPAAAATYARTSGASFAGYGEMLYENYAGRNQEGDAVNKTTQFDYLRAVVYTGYRFGERFLFNSEIEVEHANEIFVEFAYLDWRVSDGLGLRAGLLLMPVGLVNEFHEPTVFLGAERAVTENRIIPSTWRANGAGIYGSSGRLAYRAYVVNGLKGSGFSSGGFRGGRQKGSKAKSSSMALTGRVDLTVTPGVFIGASAFTGGAGHGEIRLDGTEVDANVTIFDLHAQARVRGFDLRALYARASLDQAGQLNRALGLEGNKGVGSGMAGYYVQAGYNLLSRTLSEVSLTPYMRYEVVDTQASMPAGFERNPSTRASYFTAGLELRPIQPIVVKVDHAWVGNDANTGLNQFNVNVGFAF